MVRRRAAGEAWRTAEGWIGGAEEQTDIKFRSSPDSGEKGTVFDDSRGKLTEQDRLSKCRWLDGEAGRRKLLKGAEMHADKAKSSWDFEARDDGHAHVGSTSLYGFRKLDGIRLVMTKQLAKSS